MVEIDKYIYANGPAASAASHSAALPVPEHGCIACKSVLAHILHSTKSQSARFHLHSVHSIQTPEPYWDLLYSLGAVHTRYVYIYPDMPKRFRSAVRLTLPLRAGGPFCWIFSFCGPLSQDTSTARDRKRQIQGNSPRRISTRRGRSGSGQMRDEAADSSCVLLLTF